MNKEDFAALLRTRPSHFYKYLIGKKKLVGAEIGVWKGDHAYVLLSQLDIKKLHLVDPYEIYDGYTGMGGEAPQGMGRAMMMAKDRLKEYNKKINWVLDYSAKAAKEFKDKSLDFVYLDGNHQYEYVLEDMEAWYPKLKKRGLFGGHDYVNAVGKMYGDGVIRAVNEFCNKNKIKFGVSGEEWYLWK